MLVLLKEMRTQIKYTICYGAFIDRHGVSFEIIDNRDINITNKIRIPLYRRPETALYTE